MPDEGCTPVATAATSAVHVLSARLSDQEGSLPGLAGFLALVPDHRRAQGRRHSLVSVLSLACAATAAGAKSLVAIAEWTAAAPALVLDGPGGPPRPRAAGRWCRRAIPRSAGRWPALTLPSWMPSWPRAWRNAAGAS
jgi:hypothetical protein